jgi:hypothetical protein
MGHDPASRQGPLLKSPCLADSNPDAHRALAFRLLTPYVRGGEIRATFILTDVVTAAADPAEREIDPPWRSGVSA